MLFYRVSAVLLIVAYVTCEEEPVEMNSFHFHTYFNEKNETSTKLAENLRFRLLDQVKIGNLKDCVVSPVFYKPVAAHTIGQHVTCCNRTSLTPAISWFMQNHGNLTIFVHPMSVSIQKDYIERSMWLGKPVVQDYDGLVQYDDPIICPEDSDYTYYYFLMLSKMSSIG